MYGLLIPPTHPPVPVCDEPRADPPRGGPAEPDGAAAPDAEPWPAPPRPIEREQDPEC